MDLTKRQQEIFDFIKRYSARYGYPPTVRDIGKAVGLASSSTVHAHLSNLERIGLLRRDPTKPRAIELLDRAASGVRNLVRPGLPLVGQVAAGQPVLAEENIEDYVQTPSFAGGDQGELPAPGSRRLDEERRDSGRRSGRGQAPGRGRRWRDCRGPRGRGGHSQALLPRGRPRSPATGERSHAAHPQSGRACRGPRGRTDAEHFVMLGSTLIAPACDRDVAEPSLDQAITRVWGRVMRAQKADCLVCGGDDGPRYSAGPLPVGARCQDCGASLTWAKVAVSGASLTEPDVAILAGRSSGGRAAAILHRAG